jgi:hypothetical protein
LLRVRVHSKAKTDKEGKKDEPVFGSPPSLKGRPTELRLSITRLNPNIVYHELQVYCCCSFYSCAPGANDTAQQGMTKKQRPRRQSTKKGTTLHVEMHAREAAMSQHGFKDVDPSACLGALQPSKSIP